MPQFNLLGWLSRLQSKTTPATTSRRPLRPVLESAYPASLPPQADVPAFRRAMAQAQSVRPDRKPLLTLYAHALTDAHLCSVVQQRKLATLGRPFQVTGANGETNQPATQLLQQPWFGQLLSHALDAIFWGFTYLELGPATATGFESCQVLPRQAVGFPGGVVQLPGGKTLNPMEEPHRRYLLPCGDVMDLGLLKQAVPLVIWKQMALSAWSQYLEIFGMPFRKGHTDMQDPELRQRMADTLKNMGRSGWGLFDQEDRIEFLQVQSAGQQTGYEHLARFADEQLSKLVLGQTMTTEAGASLAQAEVHERIGQAVARADAHRLETFVNNELLPRLAALGLVATGARFRFNPDEDALSPELKLELVKALLPYKTIPNGWLESEFGICLEDSNTTHKNKLPDEPNPLAKAA